jgi:hypothetical protein
MNWGPPPKRNPKQTSRLMQYSAQIPTRISSDFIEVMPLFKERDGAII